MLHTWTATRRNAEILSRPENALAPFRAHARLIGLERGASTSEHK